MKIAIIGNNSNIIKRVERVLAQYKIKGDILDKTNLSGISTYNFVVIHQENALLNESKLIEQIILNTDVSVLLINKTLNIGQYYNVLNDLRFGFISKINLEAELEYHLKYTSKYLNFIKNLEHKNKRLKDDLDLLKLTNKAKRVLMSKGLSEEESHQFIQKKAMDMRVPKKKLVNLIIENKIDI